MHVTIQAIEEVKARLLGVIPEIGDRVWRNKLYRLDDPDLPCLLVMLDGEKVSNSQGSRNPNKIQDRRISFSVIAVTKIFDNVKRNEEGETLEDILYDYASTVEAALLGDNMIDSSIHDLELHSIEVKESDDGDRPLGSVRLEFSMLIRTRASMPKTYI